LFNESTCNRWSWFYWFTYCRLDLLVQEGHHVFVIDNLTTGNLENIPSYVKCYQIDIMDSKIDEIFEAEKPDVVIHHAAQINVAQSIKDPIQDSQINILGTINLLQNSVKHHIKKFIFASSSAVYGQTDDLSIKETFPIQPTSFYGISKYTSELYIKAYNELYGLPFTIFRYANVYGPRQSSSGEGGVISIFINQALKGEAFTIFGDGQQTRDFIYVEDVAKANHSAIYHGKNQVFNIGTNEKTSINQLYFQISTMKLNVPIPSYKPARKGDIQHSRLNNNKALEELDWNAMTPLPIGLKKTWDFYS